MSFWSQILVTAATTFATTVAERGGHAFFDRIKEALKPPPRAEEAKHKFDEEYFNRDDD